MMNRKIDIQTDRHRWYVVGALVLIALLSFFLVADSAWVQNWNADLMLALDEKKTTVATLAATSVATSTSITLLPNDIGSPIAENIADLSNYLVLVFGAIWLQKYLVGLAAVLFFKLFLPVSCILWAMTLLWERIQLGQLAGKIFLFGFLLLTLIPTSVGISQHIEGVHQDAVAQTVEQAKKDNAKMTQEAEDDGGFFANLTDKVTGVYEDTMKKVETTTSQLLDAVAVLIVTTCVIPILVFVAFSWLMKWIFGVQLSFSLPRLGRKRKK